MLKRDYTQRTEWLCVCVCIQLRTRCGQHDWIGQLGHWCIYIYTQRATWWNDNTNNRRLHPSTDRHPLRNGSTDTAHSDSMTRPQNNWHRMLTMDIVSLCVNSSPSSQCCSQQLSCSLHLLLAVDLHLVGPPCDHPTRQHIFT